MAFREEETLAQERRRIQVHTLHMCYMHVCAPGSSNQHSCCAHRLLSSVCQRGTSSSYACAPANGNIAKSCSTFAHASGNHETDLTAACHCMTSKETCQCLSATDLCDCRHATLVFCKIDRFSPGLNLPEACQQTKAVLNGQNLSATGLGETSKKSPRSRVAKTIILYVCCRSTNMGEHIIDF